MANKQIYSYHSFLYSFLCKQGYEGLCQRLDCADSQWERADLIKGGALAAVKTGGNLDEARLDYQAFQYFNPSARKALFDCDGGICSSYRLKNAKGGSYIVSYDGTDYPLCIDAIRLKAFNTGVAVISFELEYYMPEGGEEQARKDIRIINEFGRRLYPEFLLEQDVKHPLCADAISVQIEGRDAITATLRKKSVLSDGMDNMYLNDPVHLPNLITDLTGLREEDIEPAIDDRMFVCCCILDSAYANHFLGYPTSPDGYDDWDEEKQWFWNSNHAQAHNWAFHRNWDIGRELYALTNIDAGGSSCQNRVMLDEYFDQQLYLRWIEWGTLHAVTNHSMVCITGEPKYVMDSVVNPFLIEYVPMCILGLAQRASLLSFDTQITEAIKNAQGVKKPLSGKMLDDLISLAEDFAIFQGQLLLQEITPQIQGIELYKKLQTMLFVPQLEKNIQRQLNNLYQIASANRDKADAEKDGKMQGAFTVIAILAIFSAWTDAYDFLLHIFSNIELFAPFFVAEEFMPALWCGVAVGILLFVLGVFEYWYKGRLFRNIIHKLKTALVHRKKG